LSPAEDVAMRAVWITRNAGPEALEVRETADPEPGPGQVRIRVRAAGLSFADVMSAQGLYPDAPKPPCVVGYEVAGVIDALGDGTQGHAAGQRVLAMTHFGGHADVVCVPAEQVLPMPDAMSFEEAAAMPVNYLTAYHMLFRVAGVRPGERVLVHMAAGGVGTAVLQLCRTVDDLEVFGTASAAKHDVLKAEGCAHPIDYHATDYAAEVRRLTAGQGVDIVLDPLGGHDWRKGLKLLRPCGRLVAYGVRQPGQRAAAPPGPSDLPGGRHTAADTASADESQPDRQRRQRRPPMGTDRRPPRRTPGRSRPLGPGQGQTAHRQDLSLRRSSGSPPPDPATPEHRQDRA
jgi:NADPH:quinone reductase-like Zn-dependent oxidoreductase